MVSIGSNCGDRTEEVAKAIEWLGSLLKDFRSSKIYETPPVGHQGSNYMNAVGIGETELTVPQFVRECKRYEVLAGRDLAARIRGDVPVDVDVVISDGEILRPEDYKREFFQIGYREVTGV